MIITRTLRRELMKRIKIEVIQTPPRTTIFTIKIGGLEEWSAAFVNETINTESKLIRDMLMKAALIAVKKRIGELP